jgi:intracellular sulfur oxidation DsrE/DsrF family protein
MSNKNISDEYLNSYVDDQLDSAEQIQAFDIIRQDENLKARVCELRGIKEAVQYAYNEPPPYIRPAIKQLRPWTTRFQSLAACFLLCAGGVLGWLTHSWTGSDNGQDVVSMTQSSQHVDSIPEMRKVIVQVSNSNPMKIKAALDETEGLLETYKRANRQIQVEVIANKGGVDMLRSDVSSYDGRISLMQGKYPNLNFLVCGQTISKLQNEGKSVKLLPHTRVASSAADQINKRLLQGWGYVRI